MGKNRASDAREQGMATKHMVSLSMSQPEALHKAIWNWLIVYCGMPVPVGIVGSEQRSE